jgi:hypothetical protein
VQFVYSPHVMFLFNVPIRSGDMSKHVVLFQDTNRMAMAVTYVIIM